VVADSLKALDPKRPIREADIPWCDYESAPWRPNHAIRVRMNATVKPANPFARVFNLNR
jgi:hypothetical protein